MATTFATPKTIEENEDIAPKTRALLIAVRQALIMILGAIEDYLCMPRSIIPKNKLPLDR